MTVKLNDKGLIPAIVQDINTNQVLMMGYMNPETISKTLEDKKVWFYSRSRDRLWMKGEESGHFLHFKSASIDCDGDTILIMADPEGPTCHTGNKTCFFSDLDASIGYKTSESGSGIIEELFSVIQDRKQTRPDGSYTVKLMDAGISKISQKVIEEAGESALAAATQDKENLPGELADLLYHVLVLLSASEVKPEAIWEELRKRRG